MEEDIKILEEFKKNGYSMLLMKYGDRNKTNLKLERAIENILKENENLKQSLIINKNLYQEVCNKNKELEEEIDDLKNDLYHDGLAHKYLTLKATSIPTSLIKEKIEELKEKEILFSNNTQGYSLAMVQYQIQVLQELLEEK